MKYVFAIILLMTLFLAVGCAPEVEDLDMESWEEWEEEPEDKEFEEMMEEWREEERMYHSVPGAAYSDAVTKEYSRNNVLYNQVEEFTEVTESTLAMRNAVEYRIDFYSMEDRDVIRGDEYTDWFGISIADINSWNYELDSMQFEQELGYARDEMAGRLTDTPTTFGFTYNGVEWKCEDSDYSEIEGKHVAVSCYVLYKDRLEISVSSRSADDALGNGPPLSDEEMTARVKEKIDLVDFSKVDSLITAYSDWVLEDYPLH